VLDRLNQSNFGAKNARLQGRGEVPEGDEVTIKRPSQRDYVGAALLMLASGVVTYVITDEVGAALVCMGCVGVSLLVANNL